MKPGDYYLGGRDVFGILIPGTLLVSSGGLFLTGDGFSPFRNATTAQLVAALFLCYMVGYALNTGVKRLAHRLSRNSGLTQFVRAVPKPSAAWDARPRMLLGGRRSCAPAPQHAT